MVFPKHSRGLIILVAFFLVSALLYGRAIIQNDGISYYALTLSLIHDGDFDLENQLPKLREIRGFESPITGKFASTYSCGFGVLYSPFLYAAEEIGEAIPSLAQW